eukprot:UN22642
MNRFCFNQRAFAKSSDNLTKIKNYTPVVINVFIVTTYFHNLTPYQNLVKISINFG